MAYSKAAQKRYKEKIIQFSVKYSLQDTEEAQALKEYLADTGQTANSYIKKLIKSDLIKKGIL